MGQTFNILSRLAGGYAAAADEQRETEHKAAREQRLGISNVLARLLDDPNLTPESREAIGRKYLEVWDPKKKKVSIDLGELGFQGELEQDAAPPAGPPGAAPPPPAPEGVTPAPQAPSPEVVTNLYLTPEQIQNRAAARERTLSEARARGTAAGTPPSLTKEQSNFNFLVKGGMDEEKARKLTFGLFPGEKAEPWDKDVFTNEEGNRIAVYFTPDGQKKEVNLGKARVPKGAATTRTAANKNFRQLKAMGMSDIEARQLSYGLTLAERGRTSNYAFAQKIVTAAKGIWGRVTPKSIQKVLDEVYNPGAPPDQQITAEQVAAWLRSGRASSVPPPPDERGETDAHPEGTRAKLKDGTIVVKRGGKWVPVP